MKTPDSLGFKSTYWPQDLTLAKRKEHWSFREGLRTRGKKTRKTAVERALEMLLGR